MSFTIGPPGLEKPAFQRISNSHFKSRSLNVLLGRMLDLLKTETMVSKNQATSAFGLGSLCNDMIRTDPPDKPGEQGFIVFFSKRKSKIGADLEIIIQI